ncbi:BTB/POZ domain-containing protein 6-B-like [Mercenaria mercenaria]|uniref:BTB/POZ domain-containing protein 6-B-like n=1 Tax=Mercenaria mercenaria TaxID=6596 RepID=UPI00234EA259|nr:BTB/POZ domain-containing protein 6-B-like [Mercenaria mercenaria]XP_045185879.2 BTB/POZ domain-containing protein 6-B-like [Mercenaria mercenaria]
MPRKRVATLGNAKSTKSLDKKSPMEDTDMDWRETKTAEQCLSHLCLSEHLSDICFVFKSHKDVKLPAHKFVLSMRSPVFEAMFYGTLAEGGSTISIEDIEPETTKDLLRFVYSDKPQLDGSNVLRCLYAAKKYALTGLVKQCSSFLESNIDPSNVCSIHEQAVFYEIKPLQEKCFDYILENASDVFSAEGFSSISHSTLLNVLKHDELSEDEVNIFKAALNWSKHNCKAKNISPDANNLRECLGDALYEIRFPIMPIEEFAMVVTPTGILTSEEQVQVYQYNATKGSTPLENFVHRERTNMFVTIDLTDDVSSQYMYYGSYDRTYGEGSLLEISTDEYHAEDLGDKQTHRKLVKIKHISGSFVENVKRITDQNGACVANYKIAGNTITFQSALAMTNGGAIRFHETENVDEEEEEYTYLNSYNLSLVKEINGIACCIGKVPVGIETISFVKRRAI